MTNGKKGPARTRTDRSVLYLVFTTEERKRIDAAAERAGYRAISEWARTRLLDAAAKVRS